MVLSTTYVSHGSVWTDKPAEPEMAKGLTRATCYGGSLRFNTPMLFALGFIALFTLGGRPNTHYC